MNAIEFEDPIRADDFVRECLRHGILTKITKGGTIRMCPPLIITSEQIDEMFDKFEKAMVSVLDWATREGFVNA